MIYNCFKILMILNFTFSWSQNYISFRNMLNEANFWFYEQQYDSARVYYEKAEEFNLKFFPEEIHLYSRTLWELGLKDKSISFLINSDGLKDFFLKDTTYYLGLSLEKRLSISLKLNRVELDLLTNRMIFYDSLRNLDQIHRFKASNFEKGTIKYDSIWKIINYQDSLNWETFIKEIKLNGYPGGYSMAPVGPGTILIHAGSDRLLKDYSLFIKEFDAGRMSSYDFANAIDRFFVMKNNQSMYNMYLGKEEDEVPSPIMIFVNRCLIGMSPYYDVYIPKLYPRGKTPPKSKLYEYYKRSKENFNCIKIK